MDLRRGSCRMPDVTWKPATGTRKVVGCALVCISLWLDASVDNKPPSITPCNRLILMRMVQAADPHLGASFLLDLMFLCQRLFTSDCTILRFRTVTSAVSIFSYPGLFHSAISSLIWEDKPIFCFCDILEVLEPREACAHSIRFGFSPCLNDKGLGWSKGAGWRQEGGLSNH